MKDKKVNRNITVKPVSLGGKVYKLEKIAVSNCLACHARTEYSVGKMPVCNNQTCYDVVAPKAIEAHHKQQSMRFEQRAYA